MTVLDQWKAKQPLKDKIEAQDAEISRLRQALQEITDAYTNHSPFYMREIARKALDDTGRKT